MPIVVHGSMLSMQSRFEALIKALGGHRREAGAVFENIIEPRYSAEDRHYHNLSHVEACLDLLERHPPTESFGTLFAIELALWFHDLIYDPISNANEENSVAELERLAPRLSIPGNILDPACHAIMATRHASLPETAIDKHVVDIDLSILGQTPGEFGVYEDAIRKEYSFVGEEAWKQGRRAVLQHFLDREWIYSTPTFRCLFESAARYNLKCSLTRLV